MNINSIINIISNLEDKINILNYDELSFSIRINDHNISKCFLEFLEDMKINDYLEYEFNTNILNVILNTSFKDVFNITFNILKKCIDNDFDYEKVKSKEFDLSLITINQISAELKKRPNLSFAIVWSENNGKENISLEGNGNPNNIVGLLTRGTHMAVEWANRKKD